MTRTHLAVLVVVVLLIAPAPVVAVVRGSPDLSVTAPSNTFVPGAEGTLDVTLTNEGDLDTGSAQNPELNARVTTARGVRATLDAGNAPIEVETGTQSIGRLPEGGSGTLPFQLTVDEDAPPGTYTLELTVTYSHTSVISERTGTENRRDVTRHFDVEVEIDDRARFEVISTETDARVGSTGTVSVTMENVGSEPATGTSVALVSQNADVTFGQSSSAARFVGDWAPGERRTVAYQVTAADTAEQQDYAFTATATFEDSDGITRKSDPLSLSVRPEAEQQFTVVSTESNVAVGDSGDVRLTLRNDGSIPVSDATVTLRSRSSEVVFGGSASAARFVGDWAPGETRTVEYDVAATEAADTRSYALQATVAYADQDGDPATARPLSLGITPDPEQGFALSNVSASLYVGEEGTITGTVTNEGRTAARDVVIRFAPQSQHVVPTETEYAVGTLRPGEAADFEFTARVGGQADPGPRQFSFVAAYRNREDEPRTSDELLSRQTVAPRRTRLSVSGVETNVSVDASNRVVLSVRNTADVTFRNVSVSISPREPFSSVSPEARVESLAPGETVRVTFELSVADDAVPSTHGLRADIVAEEPDGDLYHGDPTLVPVTVRTQSILDGDWGVVLIGGVLVAGVLLAGYLLSNRR